MAQTKVYVLDTSVLLSAGKRALFAFSGGEVIIPIAVVKELEAKRNDPLVGFVARQVLHEIESLRDRYGNQLFDKGVSVNSTTLRVEVNHIDS